MHFKMLVVRIELWPWGSEADKKEIARMRIYNTGYGDKVSGEYTGEIWRGDTPAEFDKKIPSMVGAVKSWPRELHVWNLVKQMLENMKYGLDGPKGWK